MELARRIRGSLSGSIDISLLEDAVISHRIFQRLRRVKQTAFLSYVFPGATHTRFEHSLGSMHLAKKAWVKLAENQKRLALASTKYVNFCEREKQKDSKESIQHGLLAPTFSIIDEVFSSDYNLQCLRLAALLHDVGHPPFSHSGEQFLPSWEDLYTASLQAPQYLKDYLKIQSMERKSERSSHEVYSFLLIDRILSDVYATAPDLSLKVAARDVISILCPLIAPVSDSELGKNKLNRLLNELVSGEIDIDRMDYLQRDARECGVVYGMFDEERLMDSICFYYHPKDAFFHLGILYSGLAAFEDYLRARQSMYVQLYFHKTAVACEAMLKKIGRLVGKFLPTDLDLYVGIDESNFADFLLTDLPKNLSADEKLYLKSLLRDLFYDRKLWKRAYEATARGSSDSDLYDLKRAESILKEFNLPYEKISSQNLLSKIKPRKQSEESVNNLKVIKKDSKQFLRVFPIEDLSNIGSKDQEIRLHRLYIDETDKKEAQRFRQVLLNSL